jgi:7-cyano-7-deazaguanine synthase
MKNPKAIVLFSGGQDSTTCLAQACHDFPGQVEALAINYGQRHKIELEQAKIIADIAKVPLQIIDLSLMSTLTQNALTNPAIQIDQKSGELPNTFVPGRNLVFINIAAIIAYTKKIQHIYTGVCQTDYSGYPDCRQDFIQSLNQTINLAMETQFKIHTPLMFLTKAETILLMQKLGKLEWYQHTHTCYEGKRPACGKCPSCILRLKGFEEAGIKDPISI